MDLIDPIKQAIARGIKGNWHGTSVLVDTDRVTRDFMDLVPEFAKIEKLTDFREKFVTSLKAAMERELPDVVITSPVEGAPITFKSATSIGVEEAQAIDKTEPMTLQKTSVDAVTTVAQVCLMRIVSDRYGISIAADAAAGKMGQTKAKEVEGDEDALESDGKDGQQKGFKIKRSGNPNLYVPPPEVVEKAKAKEAAKAAASKAAAVEPDIAAQTGSPTATADPSAAASKPTAQSIPPPKAVSAADVFPKVDTPKEGADKHSRNIAGPQGGGGGDKQRPNPQAAGELGAMVAAPGQSRPASFMESLGAGLVALPFGAARGALHGVRNLMKPLPEPNMQAVASGGMDNLLDGLRDSQSHTKAVLTKLTDNADYRAVCDKLESKEIDVDAYKEQIAKLPGVPQDLSALAVAANAQANIAREVEQHAELSDMTPSQQQRLQEAADAAEEAKLMAGQNNLKDKDGKPAVSLLEAMDRIIRRAIERIAGMLGYRQAPAPGGDAAPGPGM